MRGWFKAFGIDWMLYLFLLPGLLYFILFKYVPMYGILIAFQDYSPFRGINGSEFVEPDGRKQRFTYSKQGNQ